MAARLGRYEVLKHLASGGMADVLLGRTDGIEGFERHVVLKRIKPEHAQDLRFIRMFLDEARLAANLHHQHIVQVHDIGEAGGEYFIAMEYLHGEDVRTILLTAGRRRQHVPLGYAMAIVSAAAAGLHYAHERRGPDKRPLGIVHRDVSPSNILVGYDGSIKVVDFGIAKASARQETRSSNLKGKISYMSPEQCKSAEIDRRSDVYSLGVVLYELATTTRLFKGTNDYLVMDQIVNGRVPLPQARRPDLPAELSAIIMRAIAPDPERRFATADELRRAIDQVADRLGLTASSSAIAAYMRQQFGEKPEPWLDLGPPLITPLDRSGSAGSQPGGWTELWRSDSLSLSSGPSSGSGPSSASGPARGSGSPLGSGLVPRASGPIGTGVGNAAPRVNRPAVASERGPERPLGFDESGEVTRGGLNRPAVADERGPERPLWLDEPGEAGREGVNRPAVVGERAPERPLWLDEPGEVARGGVNHPAIAGELGPERPLWTHEPGVPPRTDLGSSTAPTDEKMGWESQWGARAGTSARSTVIAAAIAVPLIVSIGIGIWWFDRADALPARGIQVKPVAEIPPIEEVTKLALPGPAPEASAGSVPARGPTAQAAAQAHSSEPTTGSFATRSAPPVEELPIPGPGPSPPAAARPGAPPSPMAPADSSAPVAPGSAALGPPTARSAAAPAAVAAALPVDAPPVLLPHAAIERVASQHARELSKCNAGEELHGEITVWFSVDPAGKVSKAQVATTLRKPSIAACIQRSVQAWRFPPQAEPGAVGTYTLSFQ